MGMRPDDPVVEFEVTDPVELESEKAIRVKVEGEWMWIPKGHISEDSDVQGEGDTGTLIISEWIATEKELI